jgi:hypothetical protein
MATAFVMWARAQATRSMHPHAATTPCLWGQPPGPATGGREMFMICSAAEAQAPNNAPYHYQVIVMGRLPATQEVRGTPHEAAS